MWRPTQGETSPDGDPQSLPVYAPTVTVTASGGTTA